MEGIILQNDFTIDFVKRQISIVRNYMMALINDRFF